MHRRALSVDLKANFITLIGTKVAPPYNESGLVDASRRSLKRYMTTFGGRKFVG